MANDEFVDYDKKEGRDRILFKVDFEKAYDKVNWNFLRFILKKMGFDSVWIRRMDLLIFQRKMSVLVNGSPTKKFVVEKGLRKGNPLSPFLFVLVAEGLMRLVKKSIKIWKFYGFSINGKYKVDILQFANDTFLVGEGSWKQVWAIKAVLRAFMLVSGLGINTRNNFMEVVVYVLSYKVESSNYTLFWGSDWSQPEETFYLGASFE